METIYTFLVHCGSQHRAYVERNIEFKQAGTTLGDFKLQLVTKQLFDIFVHTIFHMPHPIIYK